MTLTPEEKSMLAEAERLAAKATPGRWGFYGIPGQMPYAAVRWSPIDYRGECVEIGSEANTEQLAAFENRYHPGAANAEFCVHARTAVPALAAALRREAAFAEELRGLGESLLRQVSDAEGVAEELAGVVNLALRLAVESGGGAQEELAHALAALSPAARSTLAAGSGVSRTTGARDGGAA